MYKIQYMLLRTEKACVIFQRLLLGIAFLMNIYVIAYYNFTWSDITTLDFWLNFIFVFICLLMYFLCDIYIEEKLHNSIQILYSSGISLFMIVFGIFFAYILESIKIFIISMGIIAILNNIVFHLFNTWIIFIKICCISFILIFPCIILFKIFICIKIGHKLWRL